MHSRDGCIELETRQGVGGSVSAKFIQSPNERPMMKAALNRALAEIHPDPEIAPELTGLGIYRVRRDGRLQNGKCGAWEPSTAIFEAEARASIHAVGFSNANWQGWPERGKKGPSMCGWVGDQV
jgi:hypothetical protein